MRSFKIVVEQHEDGYVAYPIGIDGAVVGQGDSLEEALADVRSATQLSFISRRSANRPSTTSLSTSFSRI